MDSVSVSLALAMTRSPQAAAMFNYWQDDGFGNLIDTTYLCFNDPTRTAYLMNLLGFDCVYKYPCQYGSH